MGVALRDHDFLEPGEDSGLGLRVRVQGSGLRVRGFRMYLNLLNDAGSLYRAPPLSPRHPIPQVLNPAESCLGALIEGHLLGG